MAYDGLFIHTQLNEIKKIILNERISRIVQPNNKTIELVFRKNNKDIIFSIAVDSSFPFISISNKKDSLSTNPPGFCMLLRKYLSGGIIENINQIDGRGNLNSLERIIDINIKNIDQKGDLNNYHLIIELLGRYSNIAICDSDFIIIDVLNKIEYSDNSLRILQAKNKYDTLLLDKKSEITNTSYEDFINILNETKNKFTINNEKYDFTKLIINSFYGLSKTFIEHILNISNIDTHNIDINDLLNNNSDLSKNIYNNLKNEIDNILNNKIYPSIFYINQNAKDFHVVNLSIYNEKIESFNTANECILNYQNIKHLAATESNEKSILIKNIENLISKTMKKISQNEKDINDNLDYDKYRIYGELINAYGYNTKLNNKNELVVNNFYDDNKLINISINTDYSMQKNAEKYFDKYNKAKRTIEKSKQLLDENKDALEHLQSIFESMSYINDHSELITIKYELSKYFNINNKKTNSKNNKNDNISKNIKLTHYKTEDGIDIYIGKNNIQNEYLTFQLADSSDTWFHIKNATGSHVIIKKPYEELDMKTIEKVAALAAYYSSNRNETKATVDYTLRKELKKVKGKAPGFCIYHKNYSINVTPKNYFE